MFPVFHNLRLPALLNAFNHQSSGIKKLESEEIIDFIFPFYQKLVQELERLKSITFSYDQRILNLQNKLTEIYTHFASFVQHLSYDQVKEHVFKCFEAEYLDIEYKKLGRDSSFSHLEAIQKIYKYHAKFLSSVDQQFLTSFVCRLICSQIKNDSFNYIFRFDNAFILYSSNENKRKLFDCIVKTTLGKSPQACSKNTLQLITNVIEKLELSNEDKDILFEIGKNYFENLEKPLPFMQLHYFTDVFGYFTNIFKKKNLIYSKEQFDFLDVLLEIIFCCCDNPQFYFIYEFLNLPQINILKKLDFWQKVFDAFDDYPPHRQSLVEIAARRADLNSQAGRYFLEKIRLDNKISNLTKTALYEGKFSNITLNVEDPIIYDECLEFIKDLDNSMLERFAALRGFVKHPRILSFQESEIDFFFLFLSHEQIDVCDRSALAIDMLKKCSVKLSYVQQEILEKIIISLDDGPYEQKFKKQLMDLLEQRSEFHEAGINFNNEKKQMLDNPLELRDPDFYDVFEQNAQQLLYDNVSDEFTFEFALSEVKDFIKTQCDNQSEVDAALRALDDITYHGRGYPLNSLNCEHVDLHEIFRRVYFRIKNHVDSNALIKNLIENLIYIDRNKQDFGSYQLLLKGLQGFYPDIRFPFNIKLMQSLEKLFSDQLPPAFTLDYAFEDSERIIKNQDGSKGDIDLALITLDNIKKNDGSFFDYSENEIFRHVYYRIKNHEHAKELMKILTTELAKNYDDCCFSGDLLLKVLGGFDSDISFSSNIKDDFLNATKARLLTRIKNFDEEQIEKFWDLLVKPAKVRTQEEQLFLEQFLQDELPAIAKELEDEYANPAKIDDPLTKNCFEGYLNEAREAFLNLSNNGRSGQMSDMH